MFVVTAPDCIMVQMKVTITSKSDCRLEGRKSMQKPRTLVVGLRNPILGDDGVGWRVADEVARQLTHSQVEVDTLALGGLSLMERLVGYDEVIIVDAIQTDGGQIGTVSRFNLQEMPDLSAGHTTAVHDTSLQIC